MTTNGTFASDTHGPSPAAALAPYDSRPGCVRTDGPPPNGECHPMSTTNFDFAPNT